MELDYEVVDVFADRAFAGNPLAVVRGAGDLSTSHLQALAREFNLSETAFPMAPTPAQAEAGATYRLRIFTPLAELPFAGHPSVGTAWVLARLGQLGQLGEVGEKGSGGAAVQACAAGLVRVEASRHGARISAAASGGPGATAVSAVPAADPGPALAAVGLEASDLVDGGAAASYVATAGLPFWFLIVRESAVLRAQPNLTELFRLPPPREVRDTTLSRLGGVVTVAWGDGGKGAHVRVFCPDLGTVEDPATGSATLALSAVLVSSGRLPADGPSEYVVRQGAEIGRPSTLRGELAAQGGRVTAAWVGGDVVPVATGRIQAPG